MASEYDNYKKDRQALIEARRLKGESNGGAGMLENEKVEILPMTFKEKWDNYWYHYKFLTFGIIFVSILTIIFVCQMAFRVRYDNNMIMVSEIPLDFYYGTLNDEWNEFSVDKTENGVIDLQVSYLQFDRDNKYGGADDPTVVQANYVKLAGAISALDGFVFLVDEPSYNFLLEQELVFEDLSGKYDAENLGLDSKGYKIENTAAGKVLGDDLIILDGFYLCMLDFNSLEERITSNKDLTATYNADKLFFENLIG